MLNDASTLVGHKRQTVLSKHDGDGKSKNVINKMKDDDEFV